jgi:hypothetical protein
VARPGLVTYVTIGVTSVASRWVSLPKTAPLSPDGAASGLDDVSAPERCPLVGKR